MRRLLVPALAVLACAVPAQTVQLKLKFPKGRADRATTSTKMNESMSVPGTGQQMNIALDQSTVTLTRVMESGPKGATVKLTYEKATSTMSMNGTPMNQGPTSLVNGQSITLQFAPNGSVSKVSGLQEMLAQSTKSAPAAMQQFYKQMFSEQSVRDMWSMSYGGMFARQSVRVGESWKTKASFGQAPMRMGLDLNMRLLGIERRQGQQMAKISITGTGSMDMSGFQGLPMTIKANKFKVTGVSYFNLDRGWMSDQTMQMSVKGTMTMSSQGKTQSSGFTMEMTNSTKVSAAK